MFGLRSTVNINLGDIRHLVEIVNHQCDGYEKDCCFYLLSEPLTTDNGYLTGSLKYNRRFEREFRTRNLISLVA